MKITRKIALCLLTFCLCLIVTACAVKDNGSISNEEEKISLNIQHADLIASMTDNIKYLNKDYLYELEELDDNDRINIIISTKSISLLDRYNLNNRGYSNLTEYVGSSYAAKQQEKMLEEQNVLMEQLLVEQYIQSVNHSYTTLIAGFSAQTTYGQYKKLVNAGYDIEVHISEVYSEPEYQVTSTESAKNNYDPVTNFVKVYETGIFDSSNVDFDGSNTSVAILDSGFDIHHTVFQNMPEETMLSMGYIESLLKDSKAYGYHQNIKVQDVYINDKIPFAYDYADKDTDVSPYDSNHGTHVAGIIGGKDDVITGVAVNRYADDSHEATIVSGDASATLVVDEYSGHYVFTASVVGKYEVLFTSKVDEKFTSSITIEVLEAPSFASVLTGKWQYDDYMTVYTYEFQTESEGATKGICVITIDDPWSGTSVHKIAYEVVNNQVVCTNTDGSELDPWNDYAFTVDSNFNVIATYADGYEIGPMTRVPEASEDSIAGEYVYVLVAKVEVYHYLTLNEDGTGSYVLYDESGFALSGTFSWELVEGVINFSDVVATDDTDAVELSATYAEGVITLTYGSLTNEFTKSN